MNTVISQIGIFLLFIILDFKVQVVRVYTTGVRCHEFGLQKTI